MIKLRKGPKRLEKEKSANDDQPNLDGITMSDKPLDKVLLDSEDTECREVIQSEIAAKRLGGIPVKPKYRTKAERRGRVMNLTQAEINSQYLDDNLKGVESKRDMSVVFL